MSYKVITEEQSHPIKAWIEGVSFDDHSRAQVSNIAKMPFIHKHIALMPDCLVQRRKTDSLSKIRKRQQRELSAVKTKKSSMRFLWRIKISTPS